MIQELTDNLMDFITSNRWKEDPYTKDQCKLAEQLVIILTSKP